MQRQFAEASDEAEQTHKGRGRVEHRRLRTTTILTGHLDWPGAAQCCQLTRTITQKGETTHEVASALTSAARELAPPKKLLQWWREHWHIENRVHWVRDTTMGEDASKIRTGSAPQTLAAVRNMALNVLRTLGTPNVAATLREHALKVEHLFAKLGRFNL